MPIKWMLSYSTLSHQNKTTTIAMKLLVITFLISAAQAGNIAEELTAAGQIEIE